jgi:hypothetical protein
MVVHDVAMFLCKERAGSAGLRKAGFGAMIAWKGERSP